MLTYALENRGTDTLYEYLYKQIKTDILSKKLVAGGTSAIEASACKKSECQHDHRGKCIQSVGCRRIYIFDSEKRLLCYGHFGRSDEAVAGATGEAI